MKKLFLSALCAALLLNQSTRPEPSWAETILNPKVLLAGLGICIVSNLYWIKTCFDQKEEIREFENGKKYNHQLAQINLMKIRIDKLSIYKQAERENPLPGIKDTGHAIAQLSMLIKFQEQLQKKLGIIGSYDPMEGEYDFFQLPNFNDTNDVTVTTVSKNNKYKSLDTQNMADLLTKKQAEKPNDDDKISRSKQLASEARQKHSVFKKKQASGKENR